MSKRRGEKIEESDSIPTSEKWSVREIVGGSIVTTRDFLDDHIRLFRTGLFAVAVGVTFTVVRRSHMFYRYTSTNNVPEWMWANRRVMKGRLMGCDPRGSLQLYHSPLLRRMLGDTRDCLSDQGIFSNSINFRLFGVDLQGGGETWLHNNLVGHQIVKMEPMYRDRDDTDLAVCSLSYLPYWPLPFPSRDVGKYLVEQGLASVREEIPGCEWGKSLKDVRELQGRISILDTLQQRARVERKGVWVHWEGDVGDSALGSLGWRMWGWWRRL